MTLLQQVEQMTAQEFPEMPEEELEELYCFDGYRRRSPVQPYRTPPDYWRRPVLRAVLAVLFVLLLATAAWGLYHSGLLRY